MESILKQARAKLETSGSLPELAFYGGTFTALPEAAQRLCLDFAEKALQQRKISAFRCSTRPDCVDKGILARLAAAGCAAVELGVQSFSGAALAASFRGYDGTIALNACLRVKEAGLALGVQLLPGLPGSKPEDFVADVQTALDAGADMLRFYPCLVFRGTALETAWAAGIYRPLSLEKCLDILVQGRILAQKAGIPVIRIGLAPEKGLEPAVVAGPLHPAMGARVMSRVLYAAVHEASAGQMLRELQAPRRCQGYFWGHGGELRKSWRELGLESGSVRFMEEDCLRLRLW